MIYYRARVIKSAWFNIKIGLLICEIKLISKLNVDTNGHLSGHTEYRNIYWIKISPIHDGGHIIWLDEEECA